MIRKCSRSALPVFALSISILTGCAGGHLMRIGGTSNDIPKELPKELQEKFEVREATAVTPALDAEMKAKAELIPTDQVVPKKRKSRKRKAAHAKGKNSPSAHVVTAQPSNTPQSGTGSKIVYPNRRPPVEPIWLNETLVYDLTWLGVSAGEFTMRVEPFKYVGDRKVYHVRGNAVSSKVFSLFYRLNDMVETYIDYEGLFSHRFHIDMDESKQTRDALELNDSEKAQTYYWNRWNRADAGYTETKEFFPITPFSQDSFSALYYLRTQPLKDGDVVTFPVINEGKTWEAVVTVIGREMIDGPDGKVRAIKLRPDTRYQGILKKQGESFLWLTDDDRKFLVHLEAKVKIGHVVGNLKRVEPGTPPTPASSSTK